VVIEIIKQKFKNMCMIGALEKLRVA